MTQVELGPSPLEAAVASRRLHHIKVGGGKDLMAAVADNESQAETYRDLLNQLNGRYPVAEVLVRNCILLLELNQLELNRPPRSSRSAEKGSNARYLAQSIYRSPALQIYDVPPNSTVSPHWHLFHHEVLIPLRGEGDIVTDLPEAIPFNEKFIAFPNKLHRVRSGGQGLLVAVITYGSDDCFTMDDHHYDIEPKNPSFNFGLV